MSDILKVAGIQTCLVWENKEKNLFHFEKMISNIDSSVDLIVLPEMFTTGFTMHPKYVAETMDGLSISWLQMQAKRKDAAIIASLVIKENETYYNRCIFVYPNGKLEFYDKRHRFTLAGEHKVYEYGKKKLIVSYKGWKICPLICYDLRFPVWSRNTEDYDLLIYMANWPKPRIKAWDILLKARAVENMSFVVGINRIGTDKNDYEYCGHSTIIDYMGASMTELQENEDGILESVLDKQKQNSFRKKLNFLNDRDHFLISDS